MARFFPTAQSNGRYATYFTHADLGADCSLEFFCQFVKFLGISAIGDQRVSLVQSWPIKDFLGQAGEALDRGQIRCLLALKLPEAPCANSIRMCGVIFRNVHSRVAELGGSDSDEGFAKKLEERLRPATPYVRDFLAAELALSRERIEGNKEKGLPALKDADASRIYDSQYVDFFGPPVPPEAFLGPYGRGDFECYCPKKLSLERQLDMVKTQWRGGDFAVLRRTVLEMIEKQWLPSIASPRYLRDLLRKFAAELGVATAKGAGAEACGYCGKACDASTASEEGDNFCDAECRARFGRQLVCDCCGGTESVAHRVEARPDEAIDPLRYPWACFACDGTMKPRRMCFLEVPSFYSINAFPL